MNNKKARALRHAMSNTASTPMTELMSERKKYQQAKKWYKTLSVTERMRIGKQTGHAKKKQQGANLQTQ